jgi:hypothetical protein
MGNDDLVAGCEVTLAVTLGENVFEVSAKKDIRLDARRGF